MAGDERGGATIPSTLQVRERRQYTLSAPVSVYTKTSYTVRGVNQHGPKLTPFESSPNTRSRTAHRSRGSVRESAGVNAP